MCLYTYKCIDFCADFVPYIQETLHLHLTLTLTLDWKVIEDKLLLLHLHCVFRILRQKSSVWPYRVRTLLPDIKWYHFSTLVKASNTNYTL